MEGGHICVCVSGEEGKLESCRKGDGALKMVA